MEPVGMGGRIPGIVMDPPVYVGMADVIADVMAEEASQIGDPLLALLP